MSKEYEKKATTAEMVMVDFDTQVSKRAGGTYEGTNIVFKAFGKVNEKGFTTKTYEFKPELRAQLEAVNTPKTLFTLNQYREVGSQFWNIDSVDVGHTAQEAPSKPSGGSSQAFNSGVEGWELGQYTNLLCNKTEVDFDKMLDKNYVMAFVDKLDRSRTLLEICIVESRNVPAKGVDEGKKDVDDESAPF